MVLDDVLRALVVPLESYGLEALEAYALESSSNLMLWNQGPQISGSGVIAPSKLMLWSHPRLLCFGVAFDNSLSDCLWAAKMLSNALLCWNILAHNNKSTLKVTVD